MTFDGRRTDRRRRWIVASGFALACVAWTLFALLPTPRLRCEQHCAKSGRRGELVYDGPATPKDTQVASACVCR